MEDRELLELAAKAAGHDLHWRGLNGALPAIGNGQDQKWWNPLTDDGAALRLAADLDLFGDPSYWHWLAIARLSNSIDKHANVRRAIVRAAAAIGKEM